ncbi:MAG: TIGR00341 family protein [Bacteroidota bacterium]|nr:TIGR00341 family protein [Bacteroidota bacterium]
MRKYLQNLLDLKENADFEKTKLTISEGVSLRGYNLWILVCSTVLASIGLDTNSTAVIIGAMLISPLMSPILGMGLSIAVHDKQLLGKSLRDLSLAVVISLGVSVLYFFLSPLGEPTAELQARTFPTLLDVLVALFGGIAGIVSISRHDQTNAIPGVAIATALMPPLCTAGFGIATMHWNYFLGAFYLFFINAVFISLATYLIVRYLHFPEKEFLNKRVQNRYKVWFGIISMIVLAPSVYFLYTVYQKELVKKDIEQLVISPVKSQGNEVLKWELVNKDTTKLIKLYYSGIQVSDSLKESIDSALHTQGMAKYNLVPMRINLTKDEVSELSAEMTRQMFQEMHLDEMKEQSLLNQKYSDTLSYTRILAEVKVAYPFIDTLFNGWLTIPHSSSKIDTLPVVFYTTGRPVSKGQQQSFYKFLKARLVKDTVVLMHR